MAKVIRKKGDVSFKELKRRIAELDKLRVFVGWLESAKYDDNTPVAGVAAVHEYGSPTRNIPPRPYLRPTQDEKMQEWRNLLESGAKAILRGEQTAYNVMDAIGLSMAGDIKVAIKNVTSPPLEPETIQARLRKKADGKTIGNLSKPLVDSTILITTATHYVGDKR